MPLWCHRRTHSSDERNCFFFIRFNYRNCIAKYPPPLDDSVTLIKNVVEKATQFEMYFKRMRQRNDDDKTGYSTIKRPHNEWLSWRRGRRRTAEKTQRF